MEVQLVDCGDSGLRTCPFCKSHRAIERYDRARRDGRELVVEREDLLPVCSARMGCIAMDGVDGSPDLIRAGPIAL